MAMRKSFLNLGLGVVGGCLAFVAIDAIRGESAAPVSQLEIASPAAVRPVSLASNTALPVGGAGSVDLREAAKKTVPAVVHVKTVQMGREYIGNPLLEFFYGYAPRTRETPQKMGIGSGVIVSEDGYIITNNHVILKEIAAGEEDACEKLMYALVLSGLAMQMTGNSRPASGAEHHLVHLWDMEVLNGHLDALHGEKVSAGTMVALIEYKKIADAIRRKTCKVHTHIEEDREFLQSTFGKKGVLNAIEKENAPELLDAISTRQLSDALPEIMQIIDALPAVTDMQEMMSKAGCVSRVRDIGLPGEAVSDSLRLAPYTRRRMSLLRLRKLLIY